MKAKVSKCLDIVIESINYIIIYYALSNMAMFFHSSLLYILFFASEGYVIGDYWRKISEKTQNKVITAILLVCCFSIHIGMVYFIGYISGTLVPFGSFQGCKFYFTRKTGRECHAPACSAITRWRKHNDPNCVIQAGNVFGFVISIEIFYHL